MIRLGLVVAVVTLWAPLAQAAYEEVAVTDGGTLSGVVRFTGTPPRLDPLPVHRDREVCGAQQPSEALVLGPDRGVRGSVVRIEGVAKGKKASGVVLVDSQRCVDEPRTITKHVTVAPRGAATVQFELK